MHDSLNDLSFDDDVVPDPRAGRDDEEDAPFEARPDREPTFLFDRDPGDETA